MKKLLALIVALAMALSCAALAETTTIYSETDIDRDVLALGLAAMGKDESFILQADTLAAVLTEASTRLTVDDDGFQWDLMLGGKDILTVAGEMDDEDDNFILGSNLIPNYVFSLSDEEMGKFFTAATDRKTREQTKALSRIDLEALGRAVNPHIDDFIAAVTAAFKPGEAQQGEYVKNGVSYNTMWPIEVDTVAIAEALNQLEQDSILNYLIQGGDLSLYGLSNAITRASQDVESYDRATTLEGIGWQVATMPGAQWKEINA